MVNPNLRRVAVLCVVLGSGWGAHAQAQAPTQNLRIVTLGGFLGYVEGLADPKNLEKAEGGLYGVKKWLEKKESKGDLLLITGNNFSLGSSNAALKDLNANAVAFSIDDFLRSLREEKQAARVAQMLIDNTQPPFVVSNGIIRVRKDDLNSIEHDGLKLEIKEDESVDWTGSVRVACEPCPDPEKVSATLAEVGGEAKPIKEVTRSFDEKHLTISYRQHLKPGKTYTLVISVGGVARPAFTFTTHRSLTSVDSSRAPESLRELPVRYIVKDFPDAPQTPVIIVAAVDPDTKKQLGADRWKWTRDDAGGRECPGDECEIDFMSASAAVTAVASWTAAAEGQPSPIFIFMSGLADPPALKAVSASAQIKFVVLDPDSSVLGRDRGDESIVNHKTHASTQIWARPEWVGREAEIMSGRLSWGIADPADPNDKTKVWLLDDAVTSVEPISGERLGQTIDTTKKQVEYFLKNVPAVKLGGPHPVYPATPIVDPKTATGAVWATSEGTAGLFLDAMRHRAAADIALLRQHSVDGDIVAWLAAEAKEKPLDWISRFIVEKLIYQMEHIVTVDIEGSKLADTLDAMVKAEGATGEGLYAAGLGAEGTLSIDKEHLRVNGRKIVPTHVYKIALPQSLAESQKFELAGAKISSLVEAVDLRLRDTKLQRFLPAQRIAQELDREFSKRWRLYLSMTPAHFEYHKATVLDHNEAFKNLPLAGKSASAEKQWKAAAFADLGLDHRKFAFRSTFDLKFAKKTVKDVSTNPDDEWTLGGRFDIKIENGPFDRLFIGPFRQSWFRNHTENAITPTRTIVDGTAADGTALGSVTSTGSAVTPFIERPIYTFWRVGLDVTSKSFTSWIATKDVRAAVDWGMTTRDRKMVVLAGEEFELGDYFGSPQEFVNTRFRANPSRFTAAQSLTFTYEDPREQKRFQGDGALEVTPPLKWLHGMKLTNTVQYRWYSGKAERKKFTPNYSLDYQAKLEWTIVNRWKIGPFFNLYRVGAKGIDGRFEYRDWGFGVDIPIFVSLWPRIWQ